MRGTWCEQHGQDWGLHRDHVVLRYSEGMTHDEIATYLDARPGTVGPLFTKALRALERTWS